MRLWRAYQGSGFSVGYLPDAGGINDQCAWLMEAFSVMSAYEADMKDNSS